MSDTSITTTQNNPDPRQPATRQPATRQSTPRRPDPRQPKRKKPYNVRHLGGDIMRVSLTLLAIFIALAPAVLIFSASIDPRNSMVNQQIIPKNANFDNYRLLLTSDTHPFRIWLFNSLKISITTALITIFICSISAYAFSRFRFTGRRKLLLTVFLVQVFPNALTMVATFLLIQAIGEVFPAFGLNSHGGLILVYIGGAMGINTWLMKGYFDSVPRSLDESAKMDGASNWQVYTRIILPVVKPILTVVALISFIASYSDFLIPQIILQDSRQFTLAVGLTLFIRNGEYSSAWGVFSAGALIGAVPIIVLYLYIQKYLVSGLTSGSVKG